MKRFLISLAAAAVLLPAVAQTTTNPGAKVDPKNNKVGKPVVEKPKVKLMTRDELRSCLKTVQTNDAEAKSIKAEEASYNAEHADLLAEKASLTKRGEEITANVAAIKQERDDILKFGEDIKARAPKLEKDEIKALQDQYQARAVAMDPRIEAHNKAKDSYLADNKAFDAKIEAHNKRREVLSTRVDKHLDANDDWKAACANKSYDEADEIAVKKELAAGK